MEADVLAGLLLPWVSSCVCGQGFEIQNQKV
jgi:hypothetical protein